MIKRRIVVSLLIMTLFTSMMPFNTYAAAKKKTKNSCKTYVFFGCDSRRNDNLWKNPAGGRNTRDKTGTEGTPRSDVIMLLKVNDSAKRIDVISVYRDTLLDVSGKGTDFQKANKAYSDLGPKKAVKALEKNLDIKIDGYVATNFKGVAEVIDELGGVTITIERDPVVKPYKNKGKNVPDIMNMCLREMNRVYNTDTPLVTKTGNQTLSGLQAVAYARVRYTEGWDMKRSVRQRNVLNAMSVKYRYSGKAKKAAVLLKVIENVDTNISATAFKSLFAKTAEYRIYKKSGFPYYKRLYTMKSNKERGGLSTVFVPCDLNKNVTKLHKSFYGEKKYKLSKTVKKYSKKITKKTKITYRKRTKAFDNKY